MTEPNGNNNIVVKMENITMRFGQVLALENVDFEVRRPEVMALLGDNGAGKSTLIKILTGVHTPSRGQIYFEGKPVEIRSPQDARMLGIETAYQDLALVNSMSIGRNFFLGREPTWSAGPFRFLDVGRMARETAQSLVEIGIRVRSANEKVGKLSGGERQSIAIGRAVHFGVKLLILDEPTSALSVAESRKVLEYTLNAKARGLSVIFITHNVHHVMQVADRYTIIRHGKNVGTYDQGQLTADDIAALITGERES
ncbi:MAG: ATP-binding cassette domain-containing protein [Anaerolineae bacterium]|nr:ATP-binding cassette domain-containing protein [Anaerolineae bacterium]